MAINRTAKNTQNPTSSNDESSLSLDLDIKQQTHQEKNTGLSAAEIAQGQDDIAQVNSDLALLSTLLGRPITADDLPNLANSVNPDQKRPAPSKQAAISTTTTAPGQPPAIIKEVELLQSLLQANKANEDSTVAVPSDAYGKTNDAILATLLKQQGIGPAHNNVPVQQLISGNLYPTTSSQPPPTFRPRPITTQRPVRPILDGLSWLWRTWQDTAPGQQNLNTAGRTKTRQSPQLQQQQQSSYMTTANGAVNFDEGLDTDTAVRNV